MGEEGEGERGDREREAGSVDSEQEEEIHTREGADQIPTS